MIEIRFHGRGGQGAVTAAELLAQAAISENKYAQGFPNFGPERRGAPVMAFFRVSEASIYLREKIDTPDMVVVLDDSLLDMVDVCAGLKPGGILVVNTPEGGRERLGRYTERFQVACVDADRIAVENLGVPIANTAIIGALIRAKGFINLDSLTAPMSHRFGKLAGKNMAALTQAYKHTLVSPEAMPANPNNAADATVTYTDLIKTEALHPWGEAPLGCDINRPGSSVEFHTGDWRTAGKPVIDREACVKCGFCYILCPDVAYSKDEKGYYDWNENYCKGCGVCVVECPKGAIEMKEES